MRSEREQMNDEIIEGELRFRGYTDLRDWALDCPGLIYDDDHDLWLNDEGQPVELRKFYLEMLEGQVE